MDTIVLFGTNTGAVGNTTSYYAPGNFGNTYNSVSVITGRSVVPVPATLRNLYVDIDGTPTAGTSRIFTLYKNGVATAMTITLGEGVSTGSDTTHTVDVVAGDLISLEVKVTGTPPSLTNLRAGLVADCGTGVSFVNGTPGVNTPTAATGYMPVQGTPGGTFPTTAAWATQVVPTPGTIRNAYFVLTGSPGAGKSYIFTLYKNGVATALTVTIADAATTGSDTTHTVDVAAGDTVYWEVVPTGTPTARRVAHAVEFDPDTDGESIQMQSGDVTLSTVNTQYMAPNGAINAYNTSETIRQGVIPLACIAARLYVIQSAANGAAKSRTYVTRFGAADHGPSVTVSGAVDTTGNDTATTYSASAGVRVNLKTTPSGTPTAVAHTTGFVLITPVAYAVTITDSLGATDAAATTIGATSTDTETAADAIVSAVGADTSDQSALGDSTTMTAAATVTDPATAADHAAASVAASVTDPQGMTDAVVAALGGTVGDGLALSDGVTATVIAGGGTPVDCVHVDIAERTIAVDAAQRAIGIEADDRTLVLDTSDRVVAVAAGSRAITISVADC